MKKRVCVAVMLTTLLLLLVSVGASTSFVSGKGGPPSGKGVTKNYHQEWPDNYGNSVVWSDDRNRNWDIYMYYLGEDGEFRTNDSTYEGEYRVTTGRGGEHYPEIYEDYIVWVDYRNGNRGLYLYYLGPDGIPNTGDDPQEGERPLITGPGNPMWPEIYGNIVVYEDDRTGDEDIYMYDFSKDKEWRITSNPYVQRQANVYGDIITWTDTRNGNNDIYMYKLGPDLEPFSGDDEKEGEYRVTLSDRNECTSDIFGHRIVYQDSSDIVDYGEDIYMYDLGPDGIPHTNDEGEGFYPIAVYPKNQIGVQIYENKIIWRDMRDVLIHLYDIETSEEYVVAPANPKNFPRSFHNDIITTAGWDIGIYNLATDAPDMDDIPNYLDEDDDNDGIPDVDDQDPWDPNNFLDMIDPDRTFTQITDIPPDLGPMHVESIDLRVKDKGRTEELVIEVGIENSFGVGIEDAMVYGTLRYEGTILQSYADSTNGNGVASFSYSVPKSQLPEGTYSFSVDWVSKGGCHYFLELNVETSDTIVVS